MSSVPGLGTTNDIVSDNIGAYLLWTMQMYAIRSATTYRKLSP